MARIETDPNYSSPTFSRATAPTDLFKKEDVQGVAAALSTHIHDGVRGLPLTADSIPNGTITSAMIADGTIVTADLAIGAAQSTLGQYLAAPSFSSTATGTWLATGVALTLTTTGVGLRIDLLTSMSHSLVGGMWFTTIAVDGNPLILGSLTQSYAPGANYMVSISYTVYQTPSAGSHTFALYVNNANGGTLACSTIVPSILAVTEQRR
jgi:hypothetical protein